MLAWWKSMRGRILVHKLMVTLAGIYVGPKAIYRHICMYSFLYDVVTYSIGALNVLCHSILLWFLLLHVSFKLYFLSLVTHTCFCIILGKEKTIKDDEAIRAWSSRGSDVYRAILTKRSLGGVFSIGKRLFYFVMLDSIVFLKFMDS